mgnify:CR=1 FL=1
MKEKIGAVLVILSLVAFIYATFLFADELIYGSDGSYEGSTIDVGDTTFVYGADGSYGGMIIND